MSDASIWVPGSGVVNVDSESTNISQVFTTTASQTVFNLTAFSYTVGSKSLAIYRNGQRLVLGVDWTETTSTSFTLLTTVAASETIEAVGVIGSTSEAAATATSAAATATTAAADAEDIYAAMFALYLGAKAADPTLDNSGLPLQAGALYLNTTSTPKTRVYNGSAWQDVGTYTNTTTTSIDAGLYASQAEAEAGVNNTKVLTALRVLQAITAQRGVSIQAHDPQLTSNIRQNSKSVAYTLVLTDAEKHIYHPAADTTARTWTIPANASVAFAIGDVVTFVNDVGAGTITIAITSDTLVLAGLGSTGSRTLAAGGMATAIKVTATRWIISGTGLT